MSSLKHETIDELQESRKYCLELIEENRRIVQNTHPLAKIGAREKIEKAKQRVSGQQERLKWIDKYIAWKEEEI
jgi:hypothetical protein